MTDTPLTRDDVEASLRRVQDEVEGRASDAKSTLVPAGVAVGVLLLLLAYFLGKRVGKKQTAIVEIRRI